MASAYSKCKAAGKYDEVSAAEVCTVATARSLGVYDSAAYFKSGSGMDSVRTYKTDIDRRDGRMDEICRPSTINSTVATPACFISAGPGFTRKPAAGGDATAAVCITHDCPPGFAESRGTCKKPLQDALVSKRARCDERSTDWYSIPNYHLGNKYFTEAPGRCWAPCPPGQVPNYAKDPVDGSSVDFTSKDELTQCINRAEYFNGKYADSSEFCPVAWIYRLGRTAADLATDLGEVYDAAVAKDETAIGESNYMTDLRREREETARTLVADFAKTMESVPMPGETQVAACRTLATAERLTNAYEICERIRDSEDDFAAKLEAENGDAPELAAQKVAVLKTACNAQFCNERNDPYAAQIIGQSPICFKNIKEVSFETKEAVVPPAPDASEGVRFFRKSVYWAMMIVIFLVFGVMFYLFVSLWLWPRVIVPLYEFLRKILTGWGGDEYKKRFSETMELLESPGINKPKQ